MAPLPLLRGRVAFVRQWLSKRDSAILSVWENEKSALREIPLSYPIHQLVASSPDGRLILALTQGTVDETPTFLQIDLEEKTALNIGFSKVLYQSILRSPAGNVSFVTLEGGSRGPLLGIGPVTSSGLATGLVGPAEDYLLPTWRPDGQQIAYLADGVEEDLTTNALHRLAVVPVIDMTYSWNPLDRHKVPVDIVHDSLTSSLFNRHRFDVIERKRLEQVVVERDLSSSGKVQKVGKSLGVDYLISAAVLDWQPELIFLKSSAEVAINFKIIDVRTGMVVRTETIRESPARTHNFDGSHSAVQRALQSCIDKAINGIETALEKRTLRGSIVKVDGNKVYVNMGSRSGVQPGMKLVVRGKEGRLLDPETGFTVGEITPRIGEVQVTAVARDYSIVTILNSGRRLTHGDRVEAARRDQ